MPNSNSLFFLSFSRHKFRKEKKPKERKKVARLSGKEGSAHEEEYLINALRLLIPSAKYQNEVGKLIKILVYFGEVSKSKQLQTKLEEFLASVSQDLHLLIPIAQQIVQEKQQKQFPIPKNKHVKEIDNPALLYEKTNWQTNLF